MRDTKIRIAIVDDHPAVSLGLSELLESKYSQIKVIFTAVSGMEALEKLESLTIDLMLLDLDMPVLNGEETFDLVRAKFAMVSVIIYTGFYNQAFVSRLMKKKVDAVISKTWPLEKIAHAITEVFELGRYVDAVTLGLRPEQRGQPSVEAGYVESDHSVLEVQILKMMCLGKTSAEISRLIRRSERTVEGYRSAIWKKTGIDPGNIDKLRLYALDHGLINIL